MTSAIDAVPLTSEGGSRLHAQTAELRAAGPAVRVGLPEGVTAWSVTRGDVVKRLMNDSQVSKDARRHWPGYRAGAIRWLYSWVDVQSMLTADGADHARLRTLIGKAFTPRRIEALRPMVERIVNDLLDAMESHRGDASVDLRAHFSYGVPTEVICGMFGVPGEQRADMLRVIDSVLATDVTEEESEAIGRDLFRVMTTLIETKRRSPGDDMTSLLLDAHEDGDRLSEAELVSTLILMIGAGSETAVALINHAVRELLSHPGQLAAVLADPRRWEDVVEETLRLHPPIVHMPLRFAVTDIDLGDGVTIRAGDPILVGFGAHGRDPGVHERPEAFDIDRPGKEHLAFGHGLHYCLGAPLARLEAMVALPALFDRFPRLALAADEPSPQRSFIGNDLTRLPVRPGPPA